MHRYIAVIAVCLGVVAAHARPAVAEPVDEADAAEVVAGIEADPHNGAAVFTPTALTQPSGTTTVRSRELAVLGLVYGARDDLEATLDIATIPRVNFAVGAKWRVGRRGRVRLAVTANYAFVAAEHDGSWSAGLVGVVGSACIDVVCDSMVSATAQVGHYALLGEESETGNPVIGAVSWIQRLSRRVKLVGEIVGAVNDPALDDELVTLSAGLRVHTTRFAIDAGLVHALDWDETGMHHVDGPAPFGEVGIPWLAVSGRWP
jgi:hypothetical protein